MALQRNGHSSRHNDIVEAEGSKLPSQRQA